MTNTTSSFKYVEYKGDDAADVLVSLIMNLNYPDVQRPDGEERDMESSNHPVGFSANPHPEEVE